MDTPEERMENIRVKKGLSYAFLADLLGNVISLDGIRKALKNNRIKKEYLEIWSEKLDISLDWLLYGNGAENSKSKVVDSVARDEIREEVNKLLEENKELKDKLIRSLERENGLKDEMLKILKDADYRP